MQKDKETPLNEASATHAKETEPSASEPLHHNLFKKLVGVKYVQPVAEQDPTTVQAAGRHRLASPHFLVAIFLIVSITGLIFTLINYWPQPHNPIKSGVFAGVVITNQDQTHAAKSLAVAAISQKFQVNIDGTVYAFNAKDLGVKRDVSALLEATYLSSQPIKERLTGGAKTEPPIKTYVQKARLVTAIQSKLTQSQKAQDASLSISGDAIIVNPDVSGTVIDYDQLIGQIERSDLHSKISLTAKFTKLQAAISAEAAEAAKAQAETLIAPQYGITTDGAGDKFASPAQKASWLVFTPSDTNHNIGVSINANAAKKTLSSLAQSFTHPVQDITTLTLLDGSSMTLDAGQAGITLDQDSLNNGLAALSTALNSHQPYTMSLQLNVQQPGERNLGTAEGGKFVLVDIAGFKAYAIDGATVDRTMMVSTGRASMPTPKGHFQILSKTRLITMRGCAAPVGCWVVPNVPNAEFFTTDGDALHGTWWHVDWGHQNLSHGCVNLQLDDAAWLYDWTEIGTDVVVV